MRGLLMLLIAIVACGTAAPAADSAEPRQAPPMPAINPFPRPMGRAETVRQWAFDREPGGWAAEHQCEVTTAGGLLKIRSKGDDPYLHTRLDLPSGMFVFQMKARGRTGTGGAIFWTTDQAPWSERQAVHFPLNDDGQWHEYNVPFTAAGRLSDLRLDAGSAPGEFEIEWIRLVRQTPHPLVIERVAVEQKVVRFTVKNESDQRQEFSAAGKPVSLEAGKTMDIERPIPGIKPLEPITLEIGAKGFPPLRRTTFVFNSAAPWHGPGIFTEKPVVQPGKPSGIFVHVAEDGSAARISMRHLVVARIGPLVHFDGEVPKLKLVKEDWPIRYEGDGVTMTIAAKGREVSFIIASQRPCEGPVVRPIGTMKHALFAGLEYLSEGETSSSKLDIESEGHLRYAPDPLKVTMPLMAISTNDAAVAMTWTDMSLQPTFATPNFFDGTDDHRLALRGKHIEATIRISGPSLDAPPPGLPALTPRPGPGATKYWSELEDQILWAVKRRGLPPLPKESRTKEEQRKLCLVALNGPLRTEAGWGHCVEPKWKRQPFADIASAYWRLSGEVPKLDRLVPGGAHVRNEAIYFVTGRAGEWLRHKQAEAKHLMAQQQPDGSFRYDGPYRRGHFEDTSSGACARPAAMLLECARLTGDKEALAAGLLTLDYMNRFRVPRGAQTWELSLHTPDQLASTYLVWAYVRGFELTGKKAYLAEARRWALSGVPFVYLWGRYPVMPYATIAVYGATNWQAPDWMGLPVQWVGGVYAYALTMLAPHDETLDWKHLARGILISAEQQQYPDGPNAGLLPDSFVLGSQRRQGPNINPSAIAFLRMALDGELDGLAVASEGPHRIVAPFPVTIRDGKACVRAKAGMTYQVVIDGQRTVDVKSQGEDVMPVK